MSYRQWRGGVLVLVFTVGLVAILMGIALGWFSTQFGPFTVTLLGGLLLVHKIVQQIFAELNNRRMKNLVRGAILREVFPNSPEEVKRWMRRHWMTYPQLRAALWKAVPGLRKDWDWILARAMRKAANGRPLPVIGVEIPIHGVTRKSVQRTVESVLKQTHPVHHVILAVNGHQKTPFERTIRRYVASLNDARVQMISLEIGHKRSAMAAAYRLLDELGCTISINGDADTQFDLDAIWIATLVQLLEPRARGITSNVQIENPRRDNLSWQTWLRYLYANLVERAAQSWFFCVSCMSGPFMQCYTEDIRELLRHPEEWEEQYFRGERVGPGDDRTLTERILSRILELGFGTVFVPDIFVYTECPETIEEWKRQQTRWSRSGLRGFAVKVITPWFWKHFAVLTIIDEFYLALFSFLITIVVLQILWRTIFVVILEGIGAAGTYLLPYLLAVLVVNLARAVLFAAVNRDVRYLGILGYTYYLVRYLILIKYHALITLPNSAWGTRQASPTT